MEQATVTLNTQQSPPLLCSPMRSASQPPRRHARSAAASTASAMGLSRAACTRPSASKGTSRRVTRPASFPGEAGSPSRRAPSRALRSTYGWNSGQMACTPRRKMSVPVGPMPGKRCSAFAGSDSSRSRRRSPSYRSSSSSAPHRAWRRSARHSAGIRLCRARRHVPARSPAPSTGCRASRLRTVLWLPRPRCPP